MNDETIAAEFICYETDHVGKATAVLAFPEPDDDVRMAIIDVRADPPKNDGSRPWCTVVIGCDVPGVLEDAVQAYNDTVEGPLVPAKRYESCRKDVMRAISIASEKYNGGNV